MRSSSAITPRSTCARAGTAMSSAASTARAKAEAERDRRIARDARDDAGRLVQVAVGQQAVDALVHVAEPLLQPRHDLAVGGEAEMAGLDDAGVHRPDRNLVQALALDRQEFVARRIARSAAALAPSGARSPQAPWSSHGRVSGAPVAANP